MYYIILRRRSANVDKLSMSQATSYETLPTIICKLKVCYSYDCADGTAVVPCHACGPIMPDAICDVDNQQDPSRSLATGPRYNRATEARRATDYRSASLVIDHLVSESHASHDVIDEQSRQQISG